MVEANRELFTTLYAQRLFFLVISEPEGLRFEPVTRSDARLLVENRLRVLSRTGQTKDYAQLQAIHKRTFQ
jgi:PII interaction protein X